MKWLLVALLVACTPPTDREVRQECVEECAPYPAVWVSNFSPYCGCGLEKEYR